MPMIVHTMSVFLYENKFPLPNFAILFSWPFAVRVRFKPKMIPLLNKFRGRWQ
jgi:hypothetical protein